MAEETVATSKDAAFYSKILWTFVVVIVSAVALALQQMIPALQDVAPAWLDGLLTIFIPTLVAVLLKFANDHHKDAVVEALYTPAPSENKK
jgi:F0F1-type ATP synthase assembly protein I